MKNKTTKSANSIAFCVGYFITTLIITTAEAFWFQSILEYFKSEITPYWACFILVLGTNLFINPRLLFVALFITQCYIWLF